MTKSDCPLCVAKRTHYAEAADFRLVPGPDIRQKTSLFDGGTKRARQRGGPFSSQVVFRTTEFDPESVPVLGLVLDLGSVPGLALAPASELGSVPELGLVLGAELGSVPELGLVLGAVLGLVLGSEWGLVPDSGVVLVWVTVAFPAFCDPSQTSVSWRPSPSPYLR